VLAPERKSIVAVTTLLSVHEDTSEACDLREWSDRQLIVAAKTGRALFRKPCELHGKNVFAHVKDFDERSLFATWLTRISINAVLAKLLRNHWKQGIAMDEPTPPSAPGRHWEIQDDAPDSEETYRLRDRRQILKAANVRLRPRVRRVVEIHLLQEHSLIGTAQILGILTSAVRAPLFHTRVAIECHFCRVLAGPFGLTPGSKEEFR
jgi:hypothetical protein